MKKLFSSPLTIACTVALLFCCSNLLNAQVVFSNDFEDGNLDPEVGTMTLVADSSTPSVVPVAGGDDATLGNNVGLLDQGTIALDLTLNLTDPVSLADGNTVTLDFDVAARRTDGIARTIFVDAIDSSGNLVVRFVLGDSAIFGNGGSDRQRPGFATLADGNSTFGTTPGSFWWGSDFNTENFDVSRDAHISLTFGESSFDFSTTGQNGQVFSTTEVSNFDTVSSANVAEIKLTSFDPPNGLPIYGSYFDNIVVAGVVDDSIFILGDVDLSGTVDFLDIAPFIALLSTNGNQAEADIDLSGNVDFLDIAPFLAILSGQ